MATTESPLIALVGLALAWESAAVVLGALLVGLAVGTVLKARRQPKLPEGLRERERELESLRRIAGELARTSDVGEVARALLDEISSLFGVGFVALTFISEDAREASGFLARAKGKDVDWWRGVRVDLVREPSGIASAVYEASSFAVYDVSGSTRVSMRLAKEVGAKSAAFVPLISDDRVIAVISVATTDDYRAFSQEDLGLMQTLASEGAIALERTRASIELAGALERERLLATIARRLRTQLDLGQALEVAVEETGQALGAVRCFVRLGDESALEIVAQWTAPGAQAIVDEQKLLPVSNLAAREQRTVAILDVQESPDAAEPSLGGLEFLRRLGARAVASTPIIVQDRLIGVLTAHRDAPRPWSRSDLMLLEAVAGFDALAQRLREGSRQLVGAGQREAPAVRHEHSGRCSTERLRRGLRNGVERRRARQRLAEHGRNTVEAALHACLARAAGERRSVAQCERCETGERLEHLGVTRRERPVAAPSDAEHALHLVAPAHRRDDGVREPLVGRVRHGIRQFAVLAADHRPALADRESGEAA